MLVEAEEVEDDRVAFAEKIEGLTRESLKRNTKRFYEQNESLLQLATSYLATNGEIAVCLNLGSLLKCFQVMPTIHGVLKIQPLRVEN